MRTLPLCLTPQRLTRQGRLHSGFTLLEILIVVVILGILASIATVQMAGASSNARKTTFVTNMKVLRDAAILYNAQSNYLLPDAAPGTMPAEILPILVQHQKFERVTSVGGEWDVAHNTLGISSAVGVVFTGVGTTRDDVFMAGVDRIIDDGDLASGNFRKLAPDAYYYILEK
ncbi:MAG: type II secretion system protein [Algisphaera sp.]